MSANEVAIKQPSESMAIMQVIERVAMNPNADIAKLQQMLDMQERVLNRNARMAYDAAMAKMQPELPEVEKLAEGHNSKYAKFDKILSAIKPSLKNHGFSITHRVKVENSLIHITAVLSHRDGHREETTLVLPPDKTGGKNEVQAVASSTEYGRRYTMNSLLGIATKDADSDGGKGQKEKGALITDDQRSQLQNALHEKGIAVEKACKKLRIQSLGELESSRFSSALKAIQNTAGAA